MLKTLWWQQGSLMMAKSEAGDGGGSDKDDEKDEKDESEESEDEESEESDDEDEEDEEKDKEDEDELDEASLKEAKNLYQLIKNPASQKQAIEILARSAGIQLGETPKTKTESDKVAKKTVDYLEEALGENLKWLAPKLASALDKMREEDRADHQKSLESIKQSQIEKEVDQAYAELRRDTKGESAKFENKMVVLADKLLPSSGMSTAEYIRYLYTIASASDNGKSAKQRLAEKINKNSKDAPGRLRNSSSEGGGRKGNDSPPMSALEAVTQTAKRLGFKG